MKYELALAAVCSLTLATSACGLTSGSARAGHASALRGDSMKGRVLLVASSTSRINLKSGRSASTGFRLSELAVPAQALLDAGYEVVIATPDGKKPAMDEASASPDEFPGNAPAFRRAIQFAHGYPSLQHPLTLAAAAEDVGSFAGVYVPGGHAPMNDLMVDPDLGRILRAAHEAGKPTALLGHGPIAAVATLPRAVEFKNALVRGDDSEARVSADAWTYAGYRMTAFSDDEERAVEAGTLNDSLQFHVTSAVRDAGGRLENASKGQSFVVRDRELITGQNPSSGRAIAEAMVTALDEREHG